MILVCHTLSDYLPVLVVKTTMSLFEFVSMSRSTAMCDKAGLD